MGYIRESKMVFPHTSSATFIMETPTALQTIKSENPKTTTGSPYSPTEIDILADLYTGKVKCL